MLARRSRGQRLKFKPDGKPGEQLQDPCPFRKTVAGRKIMQKLHVRAHHGRAKAIAAHKVPEMREASAKAGAAPWEGTQPMALDSMPASTSMPASARCQMPP